MCVFYPVLRLSETFLVIRRIERDMIKNVQGGARNVIPLIVHITHFYYYKKC